LRGHPTRIIDLKPPPANGEEFIRMDLKDLPQNPEVLSGINIVYHLAWTTIPQTSNADMGADIQDNLWTSIKLLEACAAAKVKKVIFMSSGGTVYGIPREIPLSEEHPCNPLCSYGITKLGVEKYLEVFRNTCGLEYVVLRGANPFGEGQNTSRPLGAVGVFLHRLLQNQAIDIWGDGRVVRDFFYVKDLAQALYRSMRYQPPDKGVRIFNVGSGCGLSLVELLENIAEITGKTPRLRFRPPRGIDVPANILDTRRIVAMLGWKPQVGLKEGLKRTWEWMKIQ
jgi:UDP-glucose 4-epimerase